VLVRNTVHLMGSIQTPLQFRKIDIAHLISHHESSPKLVERSALCFRARSIHQVQIKMQIVQRDQAQPEDFFGLNEMADISASEFTTGWTWAVFFDWALVERKLCVFQIDRTACGKRGSVAR